MSALFDFQSFLTVLLLTICSCTYLKEKVPNALQRTTGFRGIFWKASRIGGATFVFLENPAWKPSSPVYDSAAVVCVLQAKGPAPGFPCSVLAWAYPYFCFSDSWEVVNLLAFIFGAALKRVASTLSTFLFLNW